MKIKRQRRSHFIALFTTSDIAFLLLIFIMLVSLINYRKEINIEYPIAETAQKVSVERNLEIWVDKGGNLYLDGDFCDLNTIEAGIVEAYTYAPDTRVHIIADKDTHFTHVHQILNILQILNYRMVSLVVRSQ